MPYAGHLRVQRRTHHAQFRSQRWGNAGYSLVDDPASGHLQVFCEETVKFAVVLIETVQGVCGQ